ncbi:MAG: hypothetical protein FJY66_00475 [Calditrichaeota bacterium]|nr:hypothetical protein [Calditrichota bacterium]
MKSRAAVLGLWALALLAGCEWSPLRDNPRDPGAYNYNPPELIQRAWIETHCRKLDLGDMCSMTIFAEVWDPEGVSALDRAWVYLSDWGDEQSWPMIYDSPHRRFTLSIQGGSDSLPNHLIYYQTKHFVVRFQDDKGNIAEDSVRMSRLICCTNSNYPDIDWPTYQDSVAYNPYPVLKWWRYAGGFEFTYRIECFDELGTLVWDTSGAPPGIEDSIRVGRPLDSWEGGEDFYCWKLTVIDEDANTAESACEKFWVFDTTGTTLTTASPYFSEMILRKP